MRFILKCVCGSSGKWGSPHLLSSHIPHPSALELLVGPAAVNGDFCFSFFDDAEGGR